MLDWHMSDWHESGGRRAGVPALLGVDGPMASFDDVTRLRSTAPDRFEGAAPADWGQGRAVFGALPAGQTLRAMTALVGADRPVRSLSVTFAGPVAPGALWVEARVLRAGRAMTLAEARLGQGDAVCVTASASFGAARASAVAVAAPTPPPVPPPEEGLAMPYIEGLVPAFTQHYEHRFALGGLPFMGGDQALVGGWCRPRVQAAPLDAVGVLGLLDAWPAPVLTLLRAPAPASTVTWAVNFVAPLPRGRPDDWWLLRATSAVAADGYADAEADLWDASGALVARGRQLVAIFG